MRKVPPEMSPGLFCPFVVSRSRSEGTRDDSRSIRKSMTDDKDERVKCQSFELSEVKGSARGKRAERGDSTHP